MGKQLNFCIDDKTEKMLFDFISENGGVIINDDNPHSFISDFEGLQRKNELYKLYFYKKNLGDLIINDTDTGILYINSFESPVIEYFRTIVDHRTKELRRGRVWFEMKFWDSEGVIVEKPKELDKWYAQINRWIKKNVIKIERVINEYKYIDYLSPTMKELYDKGYKIM